MIWRGINRGIYIDGIHNHIFWSMYNNGFYSHMKSMIISMGSMAINGVKWDSY